MHVEVKLIVGYYDFKLFAVVLWLWFSSKRGVTCCGNLVSAVNASNASVTSIVRDTLI